jgi:hypothetical protein
MKRLEKALIRARPSTRSSRRPRRSSTPDAS